MGSFKKVFLKISDEEEVAVKKIVIGTVTTMILSLGLLCSNQMEAQGKGVVESGLAEKLTSRSEVSMIDITTGWDVIDYSSSQGIPVSDVFKLGVVNTTLKQKMAMSQFANIGNAEFLASNTIKMLAGRTYSLKLVYAQLYNLTGTGYIDFNGEKMEATNNPADQTYVKVIKPDQDMDYTIKVYYKTPVNGNGYFKVGFNTEDGGVTEEVSKIPAPIVTPAPEASSKIVEGTGIPGKQVIVMDSSQEILGEDLVDAEGKYRVTTSRSLIYHEELSVIQKDDDLESEPTKVLVVKTTMPAAPEINDLYDDEVSINGMAEPLATVQVTADINEGLVYETTANEDGVFQITMEETLPGKTKITGKVIDQSGKESEETSAEVLYRNELTVTMDNKISSVDQLITGMTSRPNSEIKIRFGDRVYNTISDESGKYSVNFGHIYVAGTKFTITATHEISQETAYLNEIVLPRSPNTPAINSGITMIEGEVDPEADVTIRLINKKKEYLFETKADKNGHFLIKFEDEGEVLSLEIGDRLQLQARLDELDLDSELIEVLVFTYEG